MSVLDWENVTELYIISVILLSDLTVNCFIGPIYYTTQPTLHSIVNLSNL